MLHILSMKLSTYVSVRHTTQPSKTVSPIQNTTVFPNNPLRNKWWIMFSTSTKTYANHL